MRTLYSLVLVFCFFVGFGSLSHLEAQAMNAKLKFSSNVILPSSSDRMIVGMYNDTSVMLLDKGGSYQLALFSEDMKSVAYKSLPEAIDSKIKILGSITSKSFFVILYASATDGYTSVRGVKYLGASTLDTISVLMTLSKRPDLNFLDMVGSDNNKKLMLVYPTTATDIDQSVIDLETMLPMYKGKLELGGLANYEEDHIQSFVANSGEAFMAFSGGYQRNKQTRNTGILMVHIGTDGLPLVQKVVPSSLAYLNLKFEYDNVNKQIVGAGLFSEKPNDNTKGYWYVRIKSAKEEAIQLFQMFGEEFAIRLSGNKKALAKGVTDLKLRHLVLRRDGGLLVAFEREKMVYRRDPISSYYSVYQRFPSQTYGPTQTDYYYDDIGLIATNADGAVHWSQVLSKKQASSNDNAVFLSYFLMKSKGSLNFVYQSELGRQINLFTYTVNGQGESARQIITQLDPKKDNQFAIRQSLQVGVDKFLVLSEWKNNFNLVKIEI